MFIRAAVAKWIAYRARMADLNMVERSTVENQARIAYMLSDTLGVDAIADLRKSDIDLWTGDRLQSHAPVTVRGELNVLRQILNWCVDEQMLVQRPRLPTVQVPATEDKLPSNEAFVWALKSVPANHRAALEFMMLTGLSPHEAERLQVRDAAIGHGSVGIGQRPDFKVKTPSRRRWVPLNNRAQKLWREMIDGKRPLDTALPTGCAMQKALARARTADPAAPPDARRVTPKLMRQWFASQIAGEAPEHVLQRLMGHAPGSKITRKHYVRSSDDAMERAVGGLKA